MTDIEKKHLAQKAKEYVEHYDCLNHDVTPDDMEIAFASGYEICMKDLLYWTDREELEKMLNEATEQCNQQALRITELENKLHDKEAELNGLKDYILPQVRKNQEDIELLKRHGGLKVNDFGDVEN